VQGRVVTVAVDGMTFIAPVKVGDVLCVYTAIERVGTTSIILNLEAWVRRNRIEDRVKVTEARFVYVSIDEFGKKRPIPPL
jgi:acyl-CoA thioesterase YciA